MKIRNLEINKGKPAVCVPVIEKTAEDIISHIKEIAGEADMIEWRMDFFEDILSKKKLNEMFPLIREAAGDTPLIFTLRTDHEGGNFPMESGKYVEILTDCAASGSADLLDVEYNAIPDVTTLIKVLKTRDIKVIASHHDFKQTPQIEDMYNCLIKMKDSGADIVKLAVMPERPSDVIDLTEATNEFHESFPETPLVTMSMGGLGSVSRISGGTFGSCITFGADREASAPGQLDFRELKEIIRILDEAGKN